MPIAKASCWSITINNPSADDHAQWESMKSLPWVKQVGGQLEEGEEGTPHIQGMVVTEYGRFFEKLKAVLPRAHIEIAKNKFALATYVTKDETRIRSLASYERKETKVATQQDIQNELVFQVKVLAPVKYPERYAASDHDIQVFMDRHGWIVKQDADWWIDQSVTALIRRGYFGVEFVMSNNQIRSAFKRYLDSIIIRNLNADSTQD